MASASLTRMFGHLSSKAARKVTYRLISLVPLVIIFRRRQNAAMGNAAGWGLPPRRRHFETSLVEPPIEYSAPALSRGWAESDGKRTSEWATHLGG